MKLLLFCLICCWIQEPTAPATAANEQIERQQSERIQPELIEALDAKNHVDQEVTIKLTVQSSKLLRDRDLCFLNSHRDHRDPEDFTVVLKSKGLEAFEKLKVDDPAEYFQGKTIAVTGKVTLYQDKPQIQVDSVDQIRIVVEKQADQEAVKESTAPAEKTDDGDSR